MLALRHWVGHTDLDALRAELGTDAPLLARLLPELTQRLGLAPLPQLSLDPECDLAQFEAIDDLLSRGAPLMVVLDDLHWADEPSLVLLRSLARALLLRGASGDGAPPPSCSTPASPGRGRWDWPG